MRKSPHLRLSAVFLAIAIRLVTSAQAEDTATVAVLDFLTPDQPVDSALLGLGDLLEADLSRYGLNVISRREINVLLGERRLSREGFARIEDFQGETLPWADFLLRCEFRKNNQVGARAKLRLVDAQTGREVKIWNLAAASPMDALEEVSRYIPQIVSAIRNRPVEVLPVESAQGFTTIPEAACTFYHGLDHLVRGRPEYAAEYFRLAVTADTNFTHAILGQAKAYEALGFPKVADALRETVPSNQIVAEQNSKKSSVLIVRFVNLGGTFTPKSMNHIRRLLQDEYGFSFFDPEWIPALTRETDLKLSGDFPLLHGLDQRLWLRADHMVVFTAGEKELGASAIDLVRGQLLGTVKGITNDVDELCRQTVAVIREPATAKVPLSRIASTNTPQIILNGTFSVDEIAFALRRVADNPEDIACWSHLIVMIQIHPGYSVVFRAFVPYLEEAIPRNAPETPVWLAAAGWMRYVHDAEQAGKVTLLDGYFTELLKDYPDHMQSDIVRYNAALVRGYRGEFTLALPPVLKATERVAAEIGVMDDFVPIPGCHIDVISQLDYNNFPVAMPPHGPRMNLTARGLYSSTAYLLEAVGKQDKAPPYMDKYRQLQGVILYGDEVRHHFAGPKSIFPTFLGLWQTGHIGYQWKPKDPADLGRVLVGWTFMPYPLPGWQTL